MSQAECEFPGSAQWAGPVPKQLDFDECLMQNAIFRDRHMDPSQCPKNCILMNVSGKVQLSELAIWTPARVQTTGI